ncbi:MAG: sigma-70 family RNA polymerase sigma factor, partial [Flavobacteriales bacterium]|nr:sigma-70 family RNA polymerase sigma factor [Flavobacteriales bacterium]
TAFGRLYSELYAQIVLFCLGFVKDRTTAENITSDSFLKLLEQREPQNIENPLSWIYTVSRNSCMTYWNTKNRRAEILTEIKDRFEKVTSSDGQKKLEQAEYEELVKRSLSIDEYNIWKLHREGFNNVEISEELALAPKTVANKKTIARQKLTEAFNHEQ